ncbi:type II toxin-antitoxin system Phd/YefM family antitoxin [Candidatus Frankia alpina]|uniref:type II toxin-antitoxin system Phd/YefM family antitoxin n=1 Tax=Candidatus Frankia alpina TaxID=2699483 RepID=UPI00196789A1
MTGTGNGRPAAVVVSVEERESLHETLEILSDAEMVSSLLVTGEEIARGGGLPDRRGARGVP